MRRPRSALVLGAAAALLLVSLYLPWVRATDPHPIRFFPIRIVSDGWDFRNADAIALAAVAVMALAAASWLRRYVPPRKVFGICALLSAYLALGLATTARFYSLFDLDLRYLYGAYVGIAACLVLMAFGLPLAIGGRPTPTALASIVLVPALLVSFLLPWHEFSGDRKVSFPGFDSAAAPVAAAFALVLLTGRSPRAAAFGTALFTAGVFRDYTGPADYSYGAWFGLSVAIALLVLNLAARFERPSVSGRLEALALGAVGLFLVSLFLPWESICPGGDGDCLVTRGWTLTAGTAAGLLSVALATVLVTGSRRSAELVAAFTLLLTTAGLEVASDRFGDWHVPEYGAWIAFAAAAVAVGAWAAEWPGSRARRVPRPHPLPIAGCVAFLIVLALPWWPRIPWLTAHLAFAPLNWLTIAGALLTIALVGLWVRRPSGADAALVPVALAFLAVIDIADWRGRDAWSGSALALALCAVLAACGWIESRSGLGDLRLPAILRIDRL